MFPMANVSLMVARCPSLLLKASQEKILSSRSILQKHLPEDCLDMVVSSEPSILMSDITVIIDELNRLVHRISVAFFADVVDNINVC